MPDQANASIQFPSKPQASDEDGGGGRVFFDGLPAMAAIVTMIAQPFAQESLHIAADCSRMRVELGITSSEDK